MEEKIIERIGILGLILALLLGILQYIPADRTYDNFTFEMILKILANVSFEIILLPVFLYLIFLGINHGYGMNGIVPEKYLKITYNFSVIAGFFIILFIIFFVVLINSVVIIPFVTPEIASYFLIGFLIFWLTSFSFIFSKYVIFDRY